VEGAVEVMVDVSIAQERCFYNGAVCLNGGEQHEAFAEGFQGAGEATLGSGLSRGLIAERQQVRMI
jgi:hypothetical protein